MVTHGGDVALVDREDRSTVGSRSAFRAGYSRTSTDTTDVGTAESGAGTIEEKAMARRMRIARVVGVTSTWLLALSAALGSTVLAQVESPLPAASSAPSPPVASPSASAVAAGAWPSRDLADGDRKSVV